MENRAGFFVKDWQMRYPKWRKVRSNSEEGHSILFSIDTEKVNQEKKKNIPNQDSSIFFWEERTDTSLKKSV